MNKITILIVEDEAIVAADLAGKLRRLGYEVVGTAARGEDAVTMAESLQPHLVLMDIRLESSMDGIRATEEIHRRSDVPVIYLTAHSDAATLSQAKLTGPFGYILKPFEERELAAQIELALYKHQADRQIREQREWLRVTLSSIGDAVIATDGDERISFLNPAAESLTGWKADEAMGRPLRSVFHLVNERTGQALEGPVARVLREGRVVPLANHAAVVAKDGRMVPIEDTAAPILDAMGQVIGAVLVFHDVTKKRRAEEALQRSEAMLRAVLDQMPSGVTIRAADTDALILSNARSRDIMGGLDDIEAQFAHYRFFRPDGRHYRMEDWPIMRSMATGELVDGEEVECVRGEGDHITLSVHSAPVRDPEGHIIVGVGIYHDITERKMAERALRESEERFRVMADSMPQLAWIARADGYIYWYNRQWYEYTGTTPEQMEGWGWQSVHDPNALPGILECWKASIATGEPFDMTFPLRGADGNYRHFLTRGMPVRNAEGDLIQWCGTNTDVTERKLMEDHLRKSHDELEIRVEERTAEITNYMKKLEKSNQALQEFASIASHDLLEPLRKVQSFGNLLSDKYGPNLGEPGKDYLHRMVNAAERMQSLLDALLDYSRVATKAEPFRDVELGMEVKEVLSDLEARIEETGGRVEIGDLPVVRADAVQMRQLMQNLIGNGLKYHGEEKPLVKVFAEAFDSVIRIYVEDNGIGFDERYLDKIFQPFQRLHGKSSQYEGAGMGLAICKKIVERHGGSITAKSAPGEGSIFIIDLPAKRAEA